MGRSVPKRWAQVDFSESRRAREHAQWASERAATHTCDDSGGAGSGSSASSGSRAPRRCGHCREDTKPKCPYIALGKKDTISQAPVDAGGATGGAAGKQAAAVVDGGSRSRAKKKRAPSRKKIRSDFLATVLKSVALKQVDYTVKWFELRMVWMIQSCCGAAQ
jgi:hypothetical protein